MIITPRSSILLLQAVVFSIVVFVAVLVALLLGVKEKSWWELSWDLIFGGGFGTLAGFVFFFAVGAIGWVSGPLFYGAVGLLGLMAGGALGGLGLGALVHMVRSPDHYSYDWLIIGAVMVLGLFLALTLAHLLGRKFGAHGTVNG